MASFQRFTQRGTSTFNPKVAFNFSNLDKSTRLHLKNVYACVALEIVAAALGAAINVYFKSQVLHFLGIVGMFVFMFLTATSANTTSAAVRLGYVNGLAACLGLESSYLIDYVIRVDPSIIVLAFAASAVVFVSFSLAALFAEKRSMLFLGGTLSTALTGLTLLGFANLFFRIPGLAMISVYASLGIFCLFVMYDTQLIVEKKRQGDGDYIWHSVDLFLDFIIIFKDLLVILTDKEQKKRRKN